MTALSEDRLRTALERGLDTPEGRMIQVALFSTAGWGIELTDKRLLGFLRAAADSRPAELDVERLMAAEQVNCGCYATGGGWDILHARHVAAEYARLATAADQAETPR